MEGVDRLTSLPQSFPCTLESSLVVQKPGYNEYNLYPHLYPQKVKSFVVIEKTELKK